jgi:hypothetical protein
VVGIGVLPQPRRVRQSRLGLRAPAVLIGDEGRGELAAAVGFVVLNQQG